MTPPDIETVLQRIEKLSTPWRDARLGNSSVYRMNTVGEQIPVVWCFNHASEFPALAGALGPNHPLFACRSFAGVAPPRLRPLSLALELADQYAQHLLRYLPDREIIVGGNCQAAIIAKMIAEKLQDGGVRIRNVVSLDADAMWPCNTPLKMVFGAESQLNPMNVASQAGSLEAKQHWRLLNQGYSIVTIPGAHGQYFLPENVTALASQIVDPLDLSALDAQNSRLDRASVSNVELLNGRGGSFFLRVFHDRKTCDDDFAVFLNWHNEFGSILQRTNLSAIKRRRKNGKTDFQVTESPEGARYFSVILPVTCMKHENLHHRMRTIPTNERSLLKNWRTFFTRKSV